MPSPDSRRLGASSDGRLSAAEAAEAAVAKSDGAWISACEAFGGPRFSVTVMSFLLWRLNRFSQMMSA